MRVDSVVLTHLTIGLDILGCSKIFVSTNLPSLKIVYVLITTKPRPVDKNEKKEIKYNLFSFSSAFPKNRDIRVRDNPGLILVE